MSHSIPASSDNGRQLPSDVEERLRRFQQAASELLDRSKPYPGTAEEVYLWLLRRGMRSLDEGSYGIAACYGIRFDGVEVMLCGTNTLAAGDPNGHAEINAVRCAYWLLSQPEADRPEALQKLVDQHDALVRPTGRPDGTFLISTLEPCPMCTVCLINAAVGTVIYAAPDTAAGALATERLERLAPLWARTARAQRMEVMRCHSDPGGDPDTYLPRELERALLDLFAISREPLDERLKREGFFHPEALAAAAEQTISATARQ